MWRWLLDGHLFVKSILRKTSSLTTPPLFEWVLKGVQKLRYNIWHKTWRIKHDHWHQNLSCPNTQRLYDLIPKTVNKNRMQCSANPFWHVFNCIQYKDKMFDINYLYLCLWVTVVVWGGPFLVEQKVWLRILKSWRQLIGPNHVLPCHEGDLGLVSFCSCRPFWLPHCIWSICSVNTLLSYYIKHSYVMLTSFIGLVVDFLVCNFSKHFLGGK